MKQLFLLIMLVSSGILFDAEAYTEFSYHDVSNSPKECYVSGVKRSNERMLTIPEKAPDGKTVVGIGERAFEDCMDTCVILPNTIRFIDKAAFRGCKWLRRIEMPESLENIGTEAFKNASSLTFIKIPENVRVLGNDVFVGCDQLKEVDFQAMNVGLSSNINPRSGDTRGLFSNYRVRFSPSVEKVVFGEKVRRIPAGAFMDCVKLDSLRFPPLLSFIGTEAFRGCTGLKSIEFSDSLKTISSQAFRGCTGIEKVSFGDGLESIDDGAFYGCSLIKSVTLPEPLHLLGAAAFAECPNLEEIICNAAWLEQGYTSEDDALSNIHPFDKGLRLKRLVYGENIDHYYNVNRFDINNTKYRIFEKIKEIELVEYNAINSEYKFGGTGYYVIGPNVRKLKIGPNVKHIPACFMAVSTSWSDQNTSIGNVELPSSVRSIGDYAFYNCENVTKMIFPDSLVSIGENAFSDCVNLREVEWGKSLESIKKFAFMNCPIKNFKFPSTLENVGTDCFRGNNVADSLVITSSMNLDFGAFLECDKLRYVYYDPHVSQNMSDSYGAITSYITGKNIEEMEIGPHLWYVATWSFSGLTRLKKIKFNGPIKFIEREAFKDCELLQEFTVPERVEWIGDKAFWNCKSLRTIIFNDELTKIGANAFSGCDLRTLKFGSTPVTIGKDAFKGMNGEVWGINKVTHLEFKTLEAFFGSTYANDMAAPTREEKASLFINGEEITELTWPENLKDICDGKFSGLHRVNVSLPNDIRYVGEFAFQYSCINKFESECLEYIGKYAFRNSKLNYFKARGSYNSLPEGVFGLCEDMELLDIAGENLQYIDKLALSTFGLKELRLGGSVKQIGGTSIGSDDNIKVYYNSTDPLLCRYVSFKLSDHFPENATLYVPEEAIELAKKREPWCYFSNIEAYDFSKDAAVDEIFDDYDAELPSEVFTLTGLRIGNSLENLAPGIYIVKQGKKTRKVRVE